MRLDPSYLHFISKEQLRILAAIQMGMRNHEYVSAQLITKIGNLRGGETFKTIQKLLKNKFIVHIGNKCDGYKLTFLGYDYLAIQTFMKRGLIKDVLCKIGVGKESDIYKCTNPEGELIVLKLTRLGRNSFRSIKKNRQYIQHRTNYNWLYLSRLSSMREFLFMQMLYQQKFPTPKPIDTNRHAILMSLVDGDTLCHIQRMTSQQIIKNVFEMCLQLVVKFAKYGLIHSDYNEFNLMVNSQGTKLTVIDFPQCISANHPNAKHYFNRDLQCIYKYFDKLSQKSYQQNVKNSQEGDLNKQFKLNVSDYPLPILEQIQFEKRLDHEIKVKGHISLEEYNQLEKYRTEQDRIKAEVEDIEESEQEEEENYQQQGLEGGNNQEKLQIKQNQIKQQQIDHQIIIQENFLQLQGVSKKKQVFKYDVQLQNLIANMQQNHIDEQQQQHKLEKEEEESSQEEQRFKGLTPYEIRIKIKQEKRIQREKKKQAVNTEDYIKKALRKGNSHKVYNGRGNHGKKDKQKENNLAIKQTMF